MFTIIANIFNFLFGKSKGHISTALEIKFYKEANYFGEHGTINVTHKRFGLEEQTVRFVFCGVTTPPRLDLATYIRIWTEAEHQGFIPHYLVTYGKNNDVVDNSPPYDRMDSFSLTQPAVAYKSSPEQQTNDTELLTREETEAEREARELIETVNSKQRTGHPV